MRLRNCWIGLSTLALFVLGAVMDLGFNTARADDKPTTPSTKDVKRYVDIAKLAGKLKDIKTGSSEAVLEYRAGLGRYAKTEKMDLTFADEVKVWFVTPPEKIDANGNSRKQTPAELDKIKSHSGPTKGLYAGEMSDLHGGQQVTVVLSRLKDTMKKPSSKEKGAAQEPDFKYVTQVIVTLDEKAPTKADKKK